MIKQGLILASLIVSLSFTALSQVSFSLGGGTGITSLPDRQGNYHIQTATAIHLSRNLELGISFGYQGFKYDPYYPSDLATSSYRTLTVPLMLEARYFLSTEGWLPYVQAELGVIHAEWDYMEYDVYPTTSAAFSRKGRELLGGLGIGFGVLAPLQEHLSLDLGIRSTIASRTPVSKRYYLGNFPDSIPPLVTKGDDFWTYFRVLVAFRYSL